jgi:acyl-CoA reductase-like NAD-dependent aldehyde dehydrogenase
MDKLPVADPRDGSPIAELSHANAGLIRRDMRKAANPLRDIPCRELLAMCERAADLFMHESLPLGDDAQSPQQYVEHLSITSGLPHTLCRANMDKIAAVLANMTTILRGLMRGLPPEVIDRGIAEHDGMQLCFTPLAGALGVVLPSNSPGVNSIWLPAIALKTPVLLKPGREEPWTPMRVIQSLIAAGVPREAFGFYPADHEGAHLLLTGCKRGIIFGDDKTLSRYANNPAIQLHGTGRSKIILGDDVADDWQPHLDVLVESVIANSGRSCINVSSIITPRHGNDIANAIAERLKAVEPKPADDPAARLSAFANPKFAEYIDAAIEHGLTTPGARDVLGRPRHIEAHGYHYLLPTVIACDSFDHPLANTEFLFPFVAVVNEPLAGLANKLGPSLVVTAITDDAALRDELLRSPDIDRLNLGAIPTCRVEWDQPHEGNLFEFLYRRRAIQTT